MQPPSSPRRRTAPRTRTSKPSPPQRCSVTGGKLVVPPRPMAVPLPENEYGSLDFEREGDRFEWRGVVVFPEIPDEFRVAALVLPGSPGRVVGNTGGSGDRKIGAHGID